MSVDPAVPLQPREHHRYSVKHRPCKGIGRPIDAPVQARNAAPFAFGDHAENIVIGRRDRRAAASPRMSRTRHACTVRIDTTTFNLPRKDPRGTAPFAASSALSWYWLRAHAAISPHMSDRHFCTRR